MKTLAKEAYDALDTDLKGLYQEKDGAYHLNAVPKSVNHSTLEAKRQAEERLKEYEGIDAKAARKALEDAKAAEQKKAVDAGEFEKVLGQTKAEAEAERQKLKAEYDAKLASANEVLAVKLRDEELLRAAIDANVLKEFHDDVLLHGKDAFEVVDNKLKPKGHSFETVEKWLKDKLSKKKGWLGTSTGGGTSKGGEGGGDKSGAKRSSMSLSEKTAYIRKHGRKEYEKLPLK